MPEDERNTIIDSVRKLVEENGLDPDYYVVEDTGGDVNHSFYSPNNADPKDQIFVEDGFSRSHIREISEVSSAVRGLQKGYRIHRLNFPAELTDNVAKLYHQ